MPGGDLPSSGRGRSRDAAGPDVPALNEVEGRVGPTLRARARQAWAIARIELRRVFFAKRSLWVYPLALLPAVIFFGHGYGQEPPDLIVLAILLANYMISAAIPEERRLQKFIMVFPDGDCRRDECITGTFYTDSPREQGAQMETFLVDLSTYIDASYRTRRPEDIEVTE